MTIGMNMEERKLNREVGRYWADIKTQENKVRNAEEKIWEDVVLYLRCR